MNPISALILGSIEGLTEFLPISSSGHLVIAQSLIPGFSQPGVYFDVILHAGTLIAVIVYFRKKLLHLTFTELKLLIIGTIPAVIFGFLLADSLEAGFSDIRAIGVQLIITGILCYLIDKAVTKINNISIQNSFIIGIAQAIAIIPGISRSGATIYAATKLGIKREAAAEFSFLLSIPAIAGAIALEFFKYGMSGDINVAYYATGFVTSLVFGFLSIKLLLNFLMKKNFKVFAIYCFIVGGIAILL